MAQTTANSSSIQHQIPVGDKIFSIAVDSLRYETGIHVDSLLHNSSTYYLFPHGEPEIWYGKFSGASNFKYLFEHHLKHPLTKKEYQELREKIKNIAIQQKRSFSAEEVIHLVSDG